jgi:fumarate hydratase subunit beta
MDSYAPALMERGLRCMIGKGVRNGVVREAIRRTGGVYFVAIGGAAALMSRCVAAVRMVAFPELGTEAIRALTVINFPLIVGIDSLGRDIYRT